MHKQNSYFDRVKFAELLRDFALENASGEAFLVDGHGHDVAGTVPYYTFEDGRRWYFQDNGVTNGTGCRHTVYTADIPHPDIPNPDILIETIIGNGKLEESEAFCPDSKIQDNNGGKTRTYGEKLRERGEDQSKTIFVPWVAMINFCAGKRWFPKTNSSNAKEKYTMNQVILSIAHILRRDKNDQRVMYRQVRVYGNIWKKDTLEIPDDFLAPIFCQYITKFESAVLRPLNLLQPSLPGT